MIREMKKLTVVTTVAVVGAVCFGLLCGFTKDHVSLSAMIFLMGQGTAIYIATQWEPK